MEGKQDEEREGAIAGRQREQEQRVEDGMRKVEGEPPRVGLQTSRLWGQPKAGVGFAAPLDGSNSRIGRRREELEGCRLARTHCPLHRVHQVLCTRTRARERERGEKGEEEKRGDGGSESVRIA